MSTFTKRGVSSLLAVLILSLPISSCIAQEAPEQSVIFKTATFRWNNENWFTESHPQVADFTVREDGSAYGTIETGVPFTQDNVENALGLRIQKFVLQDHHHYIINGEVIYSLEDFSIQLAKAYLAQTESSV